MAVERVAILSPGDMGHNVGRALREGGLEVISYLEGRSARTRGLAAAAGIVDVASLEDLVDEADLILSIIAPSEATGLARDVGQAIRTVGSDVYYADCNAISPQTTLDIEEIIAGDGGRFIDGSIIGGPPKGGYRPRFYVSGGHAGVMSELDGMGIVVKQMGDEVGRASGIKMCYAGLTKGTSALHVAVLSLAESLGLTEELGAELASSQAAAFEAMESGISRLPARAGRWVGEMEEIAATYGSRGLPSGFHEGAAAVYGLLSRTAFAEERAETVDEGRTTGETIRAAVEVLGEFSPPP